MHGEDIAVLTLDEVRRLPDHHALVLADRARPIVAKLRRCVDGPAGRQLLEEQRHLSHQMQTDLDPDQGPR